MIREGWTETTVWGDGEERTDHGDVKVEPTRLGHRQLMGEKRRM